jgi:hypothetical protein
MSDQGQQHRRLIVSDQIDITIDESELLTGDHKTIIRAVVEDDHGRHGIAFLSVKLQHGRPKFTLTVKKNGRQSETIKTATADWLL